MTRKPADSPLRIATRGSALALAQARMVQTLCQSAFPGDSFELTVIRTTGDKLQTASLQSSPPTLSKGLFTRELELALGDGSADMAVHSLKDLPTELPPGLRLGAVLPRADVRDVLIAPARAGAGSAGLLLKDLPAGAVVATSSTRRAAQLRAQRPDLQIVEIRGNVPTRLRKVAAGDGMAATILAAAGLARLGIGVDARGNLAAPGDLAPDGWGAPLGASFLPVDIMLPAPGQGAIGIECRTVDRRMARICRHLDDAATRACVEAERAFLAGYGGGCLSPVAALAEVGSDGLRLSAVAFDGERIWRETAVGPVSRARVMGGRLGRSARRALGV